jgi:predicted nucleic acid-binding protein
MSVKVFLDTNVLVYAFGREADVKREKARVIIGDPHAEWWLVSESFKSFVMSRCTVSKSRCCQRI